MKNKQQPFFTWYFILAFLAFLLIQTYLIGAQNGGRGIPKKGRLR